MSRTYQAAYNQLLPQATQVADPFHVVATANRHLTQTRRRVQNETTGHRGRKQDPLYKVRNLLTLAHENSTATAKGDCGASSTPETPAGKSAWPGTPRKPSGKSTKPPTPKTTPPPVCSPKTSNTNPAPRRSTNSAAPSWHPQIVAWHHARVSNASTEAVNNLIKRVKRVAFGLRNFRNYRIRALLYAGKPNPNLLPTLTPP